jgi:hypothetical protein
MAATTISRTNIGTNDDGSGTTGTVINTSYIGLAIYDAIDALFSSTTGIRLNQAGGDAAIISLESSDVAHGMTSAVGTDTYGDVRKVSGTDGGLLLRGFTEVTNAVGIQAWYTSDNSTRSTAGTGPISLAALLKSGTSAGDPAANANLVIIQSNGTTRFIFDSDGDSHQDVGTAWTNFDAHDDIALLDAFTGLVSQPADPLRSQFANLVCEHRDALVKNRIVTMNDHEGGDGSIFVNWSRFHMLMIGAVRQLGRELADTRGRLLAIEAKA